MFPRTQQCAQVIWLFLNPCHEKTHRLELNVILLPLSGFLLNHIERISTHCIETQETDDHSLTTFSIYNSISVLHLPIHSDDDQIQINV